MMYTALHNYPSLMTSLRHYYKLDSNANDSITSGAINGTSTNMVYNATYGYISGGAFFNPLKNSYITLTSNSFFGSSTTDRTIAFWLYPKAINNGHIFATSRDGESYTRTITTGCSAGKLRFYQIYKISGAYVGYATAVDSVTEDAWVHYVVSLSLSERRCVQYLNGVKVLTSTVAAGNFDVATLYTRLGANIQSSPGEFYKGNIDEAAFWNRALTELDVANLYNGGVGNTYPF